MRLAPGQQSYMTALNTPLQTTGESGIGSGESGIGNACLLPTPHSLFPRSKSPQRTVVYRRRNFVEKVPSSATFGGVGIDHQPTDHETGVVSGPPLGAILRQPSSSRARRGTGGAKSATFTTTDCTLTRAGRGGSINAPRPTALPLERCPDSSGRIDLPANVRDNFSK